KDPNDLEAVWTEVRALATDYGQSLDPTGTLRFNELILSGIATTAPDSTGAAAETAAADEPTTGQPSAGGATSGEPSAAAAADEEPSRKSAAEAAAGATGAAETSTSAHADDRLQRLRSPAPTGPETQGADTALSAFIDPLDAQRYGSATESLDSSEVQALINEVGADLSERATPGSRISSQFRPSSLFTSPPERRSAAGGQHRPAALNRGLRPSESHRSPGETPSALSRSSLRRASSPRAAAIGLTSGCSPNR